MRTNPNSLHGEEREQLKSIVSGTVQASGKIHNPLNRNDL
jgi:hypothetical protein